MTTKSRPNSYSIHHHDKMFWLKPCSNSFCFSKFKEEWPTQCHNKHVCIIPLILGLPCWLLNSAHFSLETLHLAGKVEELHVVTSKETKFIMQSMQHKKNCNQWPPFLYQYGLEFFLTQRSTLCLASVPVL